MVLSTLALYGFGQSRANSGFNADYREFYDDLKALKIRANLGQLAPPGYTTSKQTMRIDFNTRSGTTTVATGYTINDTTTKTFKNGTKIVTITLQYGVPQTLTYPQTGVLYLSFVPDSSNYVGPTPLAGSFTAVSYAAPPAPVTGYEIITLQGQTGITKQIRIDGYTINGNNYYISRIYEQ